MTVNIIPQIHEAVEINNDKLLSSQTSALTKPQSNRPVYVKTSTGLELHPYSLASTVKCFYIKIPVKVSWGYVIIKEKALYHPLNTTNFDLHATEETELVNTILTLAGISAKQPILAQQGTGMQVMKTQQEKL